jgi:ubiquinone biosynthesis protein UbiJ
VLTAAIENGLNRNLASSPGARARCAALQGQRLLVRITGTGLQISIESLGDTLSLSRTPIGEFNVTVEGSPINLLALTGDNPERLLQSGQVTVRGDAEILQRYRALALLLQPDLEEELSRLIGDLPAHHIGRLARSLWSFGRRAASNTVRNAAEYLAHENQTLVPRAEAEAFMADVDQLREDVDRAAARLRTLEETR